MDEGMWVEDDDDGEEERRDQLWNEKMERQDVASRWVHTRGHCYRQHRTPSAHHLLWCDLKQFIFFYDFFTTSLD